MVSSTLKNPTIVPPDKIRVPLANRKRNCSSVQAQRQGHRHALDIYVQKALRHTWTGNTELMPPEQDGDDGWKPGPHPAGPRVNTEAFSGAILLVPPIRPSALRASRGNFSPPPDQGRRHANHHGLHRRCHRGEYCCKA
jgi:hypothetical protein